MNNFRIVERSGRDMLGEGPCWSPVRDALFWVDIVGHRLHRLALGSGAVKSWDFDEPIGWAIERADRDDLVIGLKSGFAGLSLDPFAIDPIGSPEPDRPHNRLNDAKVDPQGRIWAGSKDDRDEEASGALYCLDADLGWTRLDDGYQVANGPAFSPDGRTLYHTDSGLRTVYAFDLASDGSLSNKRVFLRFKKEWGYPDGMTADAAGGLWIAHWGGGRISRFLPDGELDRSIRLPATNITSCAFAGERLDRLFVTSAAMGAEDEPLAGALFEVDTGMCGLPPVSFAG
ncbi:MULTISPECIES: SMP-30/gluconolactonase/LRE family protein [Sphingomonas]|uniref:SMP-30/gluconolactonase/LRE family protein n=1 Tax=Edaphosphingomonas fennica TaxID=114404 RepID=A0A2T4HT53_9SPHN|nr:MULTISPECIES: SMP-30/gluconolactonase/LRE family protein [Sphingomonas]AGH49662.1 SMP-30/gluconolaconase/LRE domain-containing protein [Sphingomonas sp. MM-1]PTD18975.1 SMP-30/gluconolactonase/LRE family protein [Sphingomonas fennica]